MPVLEWLPWIFDGLLLLIGAAAGLVAIATLLQTLRMLVWWSSADGEVIGFKEEEGCFLPQVRFAPVADGPPTTFTSRFGRGVRGYRIGQHVRVLYPASHPEQAELRSRGNLWLLPVTCGVFAALVLSGTLMELRAELPRRHNDVAPRASDCGTGSDVQASTARPLRLTSWNVKKCEGGLEPVIDELRALDADVLCLQELIEPRDASQAVTQTERIAAALGMHAWSSGGPLDAERNQCLAILTRAPLTDTAALRTVPERNYAVTGVTHWNGRPLRIVCVHLAGTYRLDLGHIARTTTARTADWQDLLGQVANWDGPLVVAGDFNTPASAAIFGELGPTLRRVPGTGATFPSTAPSLEIDHVLCSDGITAAAVATIETDVSDHRPVVVELTWTGKH